MSSSRNLFSLARSKLNVSVSDKDNHSLHRWVLLKNSILQTFPSPPTPQQPDVNTSSIQDKSDVDDYSLSEEESDTFMFPDAGVFLDDSQADIKASEAQWLDSLLEALGDEDDDYGVDGEVHSSPVEDDDDEPLLSPLPSPMSSSDDLINQAYYLPPIYPPVSPYLSSPLTSSTHASSPYGSHLTSMFSVKKNDPLPYLDMDDVPEAIEDTSDDESDMVTTPSLGLSTSSVPLDPASVPLPPDRTELRYLNPHVYSGSDDLYYHSLDADPLPFPHIVDHHPPSYTTYQEC